VCPVSRNVHVDSDRVEASTGDDASHSPNIEEHTVSKQILLMIVGLLSLVGFVGCSPTVRNNEVETPATDDTVESEGSGTQIDEGTPSEGSGQ